jgi:hypothetical protein
MTTIPEPAVLHHCGDNVPLAEPAGMASRTGFAFHASLSVWVECEPAESPLPGRVTVALGHYDGDTSYASMWETMTPDNADRLAQLMIHHAEMARQFQREAN